MKFVRGFSILTWVLLSLPALVAADAAEDLKSRLDRIQDLKGNFKQVLSDKAGATLQTSSGKFALKRPGYFLWESAAPHEQTVVGTPERIWVYDPDLDQVTVRNAQAQGADNPASLLSGDLASVRSQYDVSAKTSETDAQYHLVPKATDSPYLFIEFTFQQDGLSGLRFKDKLDQITHIDFDQLQLNTRIPADIFAFTPPEGADVVIDE